MATSAFRSTSNRTPMGKSSTSGDEDSSSSNRSSANRRYRSLSRFSHRMPDLDAEVTPVRRGRFVNTERGSGFPEISLDDLAVEFFDSFSGGAGDSGRSGSRNSYVSHSGGDGGDVSGSQRRGRSVSRSNTGNYGGVGRVFSETESSRRRRSVSTGGDGNGAGGGRVFSETEGSRRQRSVSRVGDGNGGVAGRVFTETEISRRRRSVSRGDVGNGGGTGRPGAETESSRKRRSVSRQPSRGNVGSSGGTVKVESESGNSRRRRSASVVKCRIRDSESDLDHFQSSSNHGNLKSSGSGKSQITGCRKPEASNYIPGLRRSFSQNELKYNDGYSSQSSAVTDDESRDTSSGKQGIERIIRAVHAQKKGDHPTGDDVNGWFYEAMRKELRNAVEEIRTELEQVTIKTGNSTGDSDYGSHPKTSDALDVVSTIRKGYARKLQQSEKRKQDLLAKILLEQQHGRELSNIVKELLTDSDICAASEEQSRVRKRSNEKYRMSKCLTEEAEKYIEDFISNVEDTDISSLDDERSDTSSNFGMMKTETFQSVHVPKSVPVEMDGVMLPWLQWETSNDASPLQCKNVLQHTPTSKSNPWDFDSTRDASSIGQDRSLLSISSRGSWSPCDSGIIKCVDPRLGQSQILSDGPRKLKIDVNDYLNRKSEKDFVYESWKQRHRMSSGSLLLCHHMFL